MSRFGTGTGRYLLSATVMLLKLIKILIFILALAGVVMSIAYIGKFGDIWGLVFCFICLTIIFWWYLANIVFRPMSKKERRNLAFRKVVKRK